MVASKGKRVAVSSVIDKNMSGRRLCASFSSYCLSWQLPVVVYLRARPRVIFCLRLIQLFRGALKVHDLSPFICPDGRAFTFFHLLKIHPLVNTEAFVLDPLTRSMFEPWNFMQLAPFLSYYLLLPPFWKMKFWLVLITFGHTFAETFLQKGQSQSVNGRSHIVATPANRLLTLTDLRGCYFNYACWVRFSAMFRY